MVTKLGPRRSSLHAQLLAEAAGQGLNEVIGTHYASKALSSVLEDEELQGADTRTRLSALQSKLEPYGKYGRRVLSDALKFEHEAGQQEQAEAKQQQAADRLELDKSKNKQLDEEDAAKEREYLEKVGMKPEQIDLYQSPRTGTYERNNLLKDAIQNKNREATDPIQPTSLSDQPVDSLVDNTQWPAIQRPIGLSRSELTRDRSENKKAIESDLQGERSKLHVFKLNDAKLNILSKLNDAGNLPSGFGSWQVDPEGEVRYTAQLLGKVHTDTQRYVKTLNEFKASSNQRKGAIL